MVIHVLFLLLATAAVALREAAESAVNTSTFIAETMSNAEAAVNSWKDSWNGTMYQEGQGFVLLLRLSIPADNLGKFHEMQKATAETYEKERNGIYLFMAFTSESFPGQVAVTQVFATKDAFLANLKSKAYQNWQQVSTELGGQVLKAKFMSDPGFSTEDRAQIYGNDKGEYWQQMTGFSRRVRTKQKPKNYNYVTFLVEGVYKVPNDCLPMIQVLDRAYLAMQFDWDPTNFLGNVCLNPTDGSLDMTSFSHMAIYQMGSAAWSRAVQFGEAKTVQNWFFTTSQYGVQLVEQNIYGSGAFEDKFREKARRFKWPTNFWDFSYGFDRYIIGRDQSQDDVPK